MKQEASLLEKWQRELVMSRCQVSDLAPSRVNNVTVVGHFFWDDDRIVTAFYSMKAALITVRRLIGDVPCVLVVNRTTPEMEAFCQSVRVRMAVDSSLTGGISRLSFDYIANLHKYFETDYVLTIQMDGFPLRRGLEAFVGQYDYIGAPWGRASWYTNLVFPYPKYSVGNGGFSLRSKKICQMASWLFLRKYRLLPYCYAVVDDVFYCKVLPRFERSCRKTMVYAPPDVAGRFSFESNLEFYPAGGEMPLGFHAPHGFARVMRDHGERVNAQFR